MLTPNADGSCCHKTVLSRCLGCPYANVLACGTSKGCDGTCEEPAIAYSYTCSCLEPHPIGDPEAACAPAKPSPEKSPLDTQVGGEHYKSKGIQPVEYAHANKLGFFEGSVVKYVTRWRDKGGISDLEKARHFLALLIELETRNT